jgi:hypothetical protein
MHPELNSRAKANQFLQMYPNLESLVEAITAHDPSISPRSLGSIRSNMANAYTFLEMMQRKQDPPVGSKRKADDSDLTRPAAKRTAAEVVLPAALSRPVPNPGDAPIEPALDKLASEKDMSTPLGQGEQMFKDQVENAEMPVPTHTQQWKTNSLLEARTEAKAIDAAEQDPVKPNKELEFIPDHVETALVSAQDEHYLEHRNANQLLQTTILPAAALTNNDGGGVREGVRRSDRDMEVEAELQEENVSQEMMKAAAGGGSRSVVGQRAKGVEPPESKMTVAQQLKDIMSQQAANATKGLAGMLGIGGSASGGFTDRVLSATVGAAAKLAGGVAGSFVEQTDVLQRMKEKGMSEADFNKNYQQVLAEIQEQRGQTELEEKGKTIRVDELRPFFPIAGSLDVELAPGDIEQKKRNVKLFNNYKPPNWPLGNLDNKLYFQNLVLQGIHWESPLDSLPQVLPGGSMLDGAMEFSSDIFIPTDETLRDQAIMKQVEFKIPKAYGQRLVYRMHKMMASPARDQITKGDTKYIHNPRALGVNAPLEFSNNDMNPLDTPMHADLEVGGSRELRPIMPPCQADAIMEQPGQMRTQIPNEVYVTNPLFNPFAMYPRRF